LTQNNHFREIYFLQKIFEQFDQDDSGGVDTYELGKLFAVDLKNVHIKWKYSYRKGGAVVMIVWLLQLQLPMQSIPITTNIVSSNPAQAI
jgi:hypothetical protein